MDTPGFLKFVKMSHDHANIKSQITLEINVFLLIEIKANLFLQKWFLQSFYELRWYETHLCCDVLFIDVNNKTKLTY